MIPTLRPFFFELERYIDSKTIKESNEEWIAFYRELKTYDMLHDFYDLEEKKYVYTILAEKAHKLNFRKKDIYIHSCYMYTLAFQLKELEYMVTALPGQEKDASKITDFVKGIKNIVQELEQGLQEMEKTDKSFLTTYYYDQMESIFYDVILANHKKYDTLINTSLKKNIGELNTKLFGDLQKYLSTREKGEQTPSAKKKYSRIKTMINNYKNS